MGCFWSTLWVWGSVGPARREPRSDLSLPWLTLTLGATATLSPQAAPDYVPPEIFHFHTRSGVRLYGMIL